MIEKLEDCPRCGEVKRWLYDAQICAECGYGDHYFAKRKRPGDLSHEQYCQLSRQFGRVADLSINSPDFAINEWLKAKIAQ